MRPRAVKRRIAITTALVVAAGLWLLWLRFGPLPERLLVREPDASTTVVDRNGRLLYESRSQEGMRGTPLAEEALPPNLVAATIAAEDRRFYRHPGIDPIAIARAALRNLKAGGVVEGGSTITQQVAKLLLARRGVGGVSAKVREAVIALRLEHHLTKQQILALYLNLAPYGNQIQGAERASRAYFGAPASLLTPAQAAFLAGLPQRPSRFNPYRNSPAAHLRQRQILDRMAALGFLSPPALEQARAERLTFTPDQSEFAAPHFVEMVLAGFDERRPNRIETTLDAELQRDVQGIIRSQRANLERHRAHNVAVVVLRNDTGEWLAWEGSGDYLDAQHAGTINGPLSLRQPGSALKPFTYALAFEEGRTPATVLPDVPSHFPTAEDGVVYSPRNYDGQYRGPLLARRALAGSENVPAVALASEIGVPSLVRFLRNAGLSTFDKTAAYYGLGITLGNAEVQLAELVRAYASFARGGVLVETVSVKSADGRPVVPARAIAPARLVSPRTAFWITDILSDPLAREYVFGRGGSLEFAFPVAVKTGTSEGYHDNWAIGYTREVTVGVWVGNFDRAPLTNSSGITGAGPIFHAVMLAAQRRTAGHLLDSGTPLAESPGDVVRQPVCALSGMRANAWCPARVNDWLPAGDRGLPCSWHHQSDEGTVVIWPPVYRQWAQQRGLLHEGHGQVARLESELERVVQADRRRSVRSRESSPSSARRLAIANPPEGAIYLIDPTLRAAYQTLSLRAAADREAGAIEWSVDGRLVGQSDPDKPLQWQLTPGEHRILARDTRGRTAEAGIVVK